MASAAHDDSDDDLARFGGDEPAEMMCPRCRGIVTEDTEKCPRCGDWITPMDPDRSGTRKWIYILAVVIMLLVALRMAF